jgi:hypothetical protein
MTDKELQEWEEEAKEADKDIKSLLKFGILIGLLVAMVAIILSA